MCRAEAHSKHFYILRTHHDTITSPNPQSALHPEESTMALLMCMGLISV